MALLQQLVQKDVPTVAVVQEVVKSTTPKPRGKSQKAARTLAACVDFIKKDATRMQMSGRELVVEGEKYGLSASYVTWNDAKKEVRNGIRVSQ